MWTLENRPRYDRSKLRYPSDVTDEEWGLIGPLIPPAKRGGNKRTVNDYLRRWDDDRTLDRIHHALYVQCRDLAGREASPTAAIIDSQTVKGAEKGGARLIRAVMTPARRSGARSVTFW